MANDLSIKEIILNFLNNSHKTGNFASFDWECVVWSTDVLENLERNQDTSFTKYILTLVLSSFSFCAVAPFTHKAHKLQYDEQGLFERIENVHNRDATDVMRYARGFAKEQNATIVSDDTANSILTLQFKWKMTDVNKSNKLYGITLIPKIQISGRANRTRIYASNIMFEGINECGKSGTLEELLKCPSAPTGHKTAIAVFLNEGPLNELMDEYKEYLIESTRKNKW